MIQEACKERQNEEKEERNGESVQNSRVKYNSCFASKKASAREEQGFKKPTNYVDRAKKSQKGEKGRNRARTERKRRRG